MTIEQAQNRLRLAQEKVNEANKHLSECKKELMSLSPFKVGDKVHHSKGNGYIMKVNIKRDGLGFGYRIGKLKKDGNPSKIGILAYFANANQITKVPSDNPELANK